MEKEHRKSRRVNNPTIIRLMEKHPEWSLGDIYAEALKASEED